MFRSGLVGFFLFVNGSHADGLLFLCFPLVKLASIKSVLHLWGKNLISCIV